ncbi:MAG: hypothetical protein PHF24_05865 [Syntrophomonas sp.]|nr:hypothetical protein [Syntrophomonas sp.]
MAHNSVIYNVHMHMKPQSSHNRLRDVALNHYWTAGMDRTSKRGLDLSVTLKALKKEDNKRFLSKLSRKANHSSGLLQRNNLRINSPAYIGSIPELQPFFRLANIEHHRQEYGEPQQIGSTRNEKSILNRLKNTLPQALIHKMVGNFKTDRFSIDYKMPLGKRIAKLQSQTQPLIRADQIEQQYSAAQQRLFGLKTINQSFSRQQPNHNEKALLIRFPVPAKSREIIPLSLVTSSVSDQNLNQSTIHNAAKLHRATVLTGLRLWNDSFKLQSPAAIRSEVKKIRPVNPNRIAARKIMPMPFINQPPTAQDQAKKSPSFNISDPSIFTRFSRDIFINVQIPKGNTSLKFYPAFRYTQLKNSNMALGLQSGWPDQLNTAATKRFALDQLNTAVAKRFALDRLNTAAVKRFTMDRLNAAAVKRFAPDQLNTAAAKRFTMDRLNAAAAKRFTPDQLNAAAVKRFTPDRLNTASVIRFAPDLLNTTAAKRFAMNKRLGENLHHSFYPILQYAAIAKEGSAMWSWPNRIKTVNINVRRYKNTNIIPKKIPQPIGLAKNQRQHISRTDNDAILKYNVIDAILAQVLRKKTAGSKNFKEYNGLIKMLTSETRKPSYWPLKSHNQAETAYPAGLSRKRAGNQVLNRTQAKIISIQNFKRVTEPKVSRLSTLEILALARRPYKLNRNRRNDNSRIIPRIAPKVVFPLVWLNAKLIGADSINKSQNTLLNSKTLDGKKSSNSSIASIRPTINIRPALGMIHNLPAWHGKAYEASLAAITAKSQAYQLNHRNRGTLENYNTDYTFNKTALALQASQSRSLDSRIIKILHRQDMQNRLGKRVDTRVKHNISYLAASQDRYKPAQVSPVRRIKGDRDNKRGLIYIKDLQAHMHTRAGLSPQRFIFYKNQVLANTKEPSLWAPNDRYQKNGGQFAFDHKQNPSKPELISLYPARGLTLIQSVPYSRVNSSNYATKIMNKYMELRTKKYQLKRAGNSYNSYHNKPGKPGISSILTVLNNNKMIKNSIYKVIREPAARPLAVHTNNNISRLIVKNIPGLNNDMAVALNKISTPAHWDDNNSPVSKQPVGNSLTNLIAYRVVKSGVENSPRDYSRLSSRANLSYRQVSPTANNNTSDDATDTQNKPVAAEVKTQIISDGSAIKPGELNKIVERVYREIQQRIKLDRQRRGL